jgi:hypothetical protein
VKGKPRHVKVFKLKYERVSYYCSHCGLKGHKKDECEKRRLGVPSLDYDAHELRCSPYKKFEYRTFFSPPAGHVRREISFASFGSAESHKRFDQGQSHEHRRDSVTPEHAKPRSDSSENVMPPLADDVVQPQPGDALSHEEEADGREGVDPGLTEVEMALADRVDALLMGPSSDQQGRDASQPIIQFPEEEGQNLAAPHGGDVHISMTEDMMNQMQCLHENSGQSSWKQGPRHTDMIPALHGLSSLEVSFGSVSDV